MATVEASIDIKAPIQQVFATITDPRRAPDWNPNVIEVKDVSEGQLGEGSTWRQVTLILGRQANLVCRIARFQPPHEGLLEISGDQRATIRTTCQSQGAYTRVTQVIDFVPPGGVVGRMAAGLLGPTLKNELTQTLERQRQALEGGAGSDGPRTS
ncbi:MAG: SRPBCC family protein [Chloroflexi bacterium]|nr:SRPBCC family protein [Chloroflexota bacterium]